MGRPNCFTILSLAVLVVLSYGYITSRDGKLFDEQGRQILFHGPNVVVKIPPYSPGTQAFDPESSFSEEDIKQLKDWGFNGMRLGVMWAGVEPADGQYDVNYLAKMRDIVNLAGKYGIYSLVEFHQDLASQKFCGDGIPAWFFKNSSLAHSFPMPINSKHYPYNTSGLPDYEDCLKHPWGNYYFSYDVSYTFEALYTNTHKLRDKFINYWVQIVQTFKDNPYVIAYQIINEPFAGAIWKNPLLVVPSMAQRLRLQHFYDKVSQAIRAIDSNHPLCFEPVTWDNTIPAGFAHPPGGNRFKNQSVFCYHFYMPPSINTKAIKARIQDAKRMGISSILSEFWYKSDNAPDVIQEYNRYDQSWFFWGYKTFGKTWGSSYDHLVKYEDQQEMGLFYRNGTAIKRYVELLSQTYPQRLSGELITWGYDNSNKEFHLSYYTSSASTTVVYANRKVNYPNGLTMDIYPKGSLTVTEEETGYFNLKPNVKDGTKIVFIIRRL